MPAATPAHSARKSGLGGLMKGRVTAILGGMALLAAAGGAGLCSTYWGGTEYLDDEGLFFQQGDKDCGGAALKMIFDRFGIPADYRQLLQRLRTGERGTAMLNMRNLAREEGLISEGWRLSAQDLKAIPLPAILLLRREHFVVIDEVEAERVRILDPARGRLRLSRRRLLFLWCGESLLFYKPGMDADRLGCWFTDSHYQERE